MAVDCSEIPIKVLLIEDEPSDRLAFIQYVRQVGLPYSYEIVDSLTEAKKLLNTQAFNIVILNHQPGDDVDLDFFQQLNEKGVLCIATAKSNTEAIVASLIQQGADHYIIKDSDHCYLTFLSSMIDQVISRKHLEDQIHLLTQAMQSMRDGIYIVDATGRIVFINHTLSKICGVDNASAIGQPIQSLGQPELTHYVDQRAADQEMACCQEVEVTLFQTDGSPFSASLSESLIQASPRYLKVGVLRDITDLKQIEADLRSSQESLEEQVNQRTKQLQESNDQLIEEIRERYKAEKALRASTDLVQQQQAFLRLVIDSNPNLIFVKDWEGRYLLANQAMADSYNTTVEELLGKRDVDFSPSTADATRFVQENRWIIETHQEIFLPEEKVFRAELGDQWRQWQKRPIKLPDSDTIGVLGIGVNITSRKHIEFALQESEQRFASLAQSAPVGIFRTDTTGNCVYVNERWCQIAGISLAEAAGSGWAQAVHPDDRNVVATEWYQATQQNRSFQLEYRFQRADGTITWVFGQSSAERDADGQIVGYIGTITDISGRKQAEIALKESERSLSTLISNLPGYVYRVRNDPNYTPKFISSGVIEITGYSQQEYLIDRSITCGQEIHPDDANAVWEIVQRAVDAQQAYECEYRIVTKAGQQKWVWERGQGIYAEDDDLLWLEGFVTDVSDRKQAEFTLQKLISGTAAVTGRDFFPALVQHIAEALNVRYALINELVDGQLHTLGFWANGALQSGISYHPAQTPCEYALQYGEFHCASDLQALFPEDQDLAIMQADSYLGFALKDDHGQAIGNLCILDVQPFRETQRAEAMAILQVFAARATAELQRKAADDALRQLNQVLEARVDQRTAELQERESQLRDFFDNASDLIQSVSPDGQFLFVNRAWKETLGYREDDLSGISIVNVGHPDCLETFMSMMQAVLQGGECQGIETTFVTKDSREIIVEGNVNCRFEQGIAVSIRGIFRDITARKQTELLLQQSEQRFRELFEATPTAVQGYDKDRRVIFWNRASEQQYGYSREEALGQQIETLIIPPALRSTLLPMIDAWIAGASEPFANGELELCRKDGSGITVYSSHVLVSNTNGEPEMFCIDIDLSDRKQAEARLTESNQQLAISNDRLARATRLKDEFLANMSHELRTPLNAILGMTEGLQDQVFGTLNPQQLKALQTIERSGNHLLALINDILDLSKIEAGQITLDCTPTPISPLCQSSLAFIKQQAAQKQIRLEIKLQPNLPDLLVDERRIRQALINLLNNAVKFTPEGGQITLAANQIAQTASQSGCWIQFSVIDTGIGIAPENIAKLFQPFVQIDSALNRQYAGTGLGLSLVKRIVELHGGQVGLTSQLGAGSCFTIDLPCHTSFSPQLEAVTPSQLTPDTSDGGLAGIAPAPLILLAEDNEANISTISGYLNARGYNILLAKNGQEVIEMAKAQQPDLILMDIQMPGIDGLEATQQIRHDRALAKIPIIAMTALAMAGDRERCLKAGANEYLTKPIKLKQLAATIQQFLALKNQNG